MMNRELPRLENENSKEWSCFFCFHVRTGTIFLGIWHLFLHLLALVLLAAILRDNRLIERVHRDDMGPALPTPLSKIQPMAHQRDHDLVYNDMDTSGLITLCSMMMSIMLIYGAVCEKPAFLLPFFCLQIFDFAITVLTATGYLCYLRSIHSLIADTKRIPWRKELMQLPAPALAMLVFGVFLIAALIKGYCISVVWRCYKYVTLLVHQMRSPTSIVEPPAPAPASPAPDYSTLLPKYEDAVKLAPPPSYRDATLMATQNNTRADAPDVITTNTVLAVPQQGKQGTGCMNL